MKDAKCIDRVALDLFRENTLARAHRQFVDDKDVLHNKATLTNGEYLAVVRLECGDGPPIVDTKQPIVVDRDGVINFKLDGHRCCVRNKKDKVR